MAKKIITTNDQNPVFPMQQFTGKIISTNEVRVKGVPPTGPATAAKGPVITTGNIEVIIEKAEMQRRMAHARASRDKAAKGIVGKITGEVQRGEEPKKKKSRKRTTTKKIKLDTAPIEPEAPKELKEVGQPMTPAINDEEVTGDKIKEVTGDKVDE